MSYDVDGVMPMDIDPQLYSMSQYDLMSMLKSNLELSDDKVIAFIKLVESNRKTDVYGLNKSKVKSILTDSEIHDLTNLIYIPFTDTEVDDEPKVYELEEVDDKPISENNSKLAMLKHISGMSPDMARKYLSVLLNKNTNKQ